MNKNSKQAIVHQQRVRERRAGMIVNQDFTPAITTLKVNWGVAIFEKKKVVARVHNNSLAARKGSRFHKGTD